MYRSSIASKFWNVRQMRTLHGSNFQIVKNYHVCCSSNITAVFRYRTGFLKLHKCTQNFDIRTFSVTAFSNSWFPWGKSDPPAATPSPTEVIRDTTTSISSTSTIDPSAVVDSATVTQPALTELATGTIVDPPFIELGLASHWYPNHLVHQLLEFVHLNTDLPWWSTIIVGTLIIRTVTFPLYIYTRKFTINQNNHADKTRKLNDEYSKWRMQDNQFKMMMTQKKLKDFYKETKSGPIRGFLSHSSMSVLLITCTMALRQMANVPVPSFAEGGAFWFSNLSAADPYYILPTMVGATIGLTINTALRTGTAQSAYAGVLRKVQYLPIVVMPLLFGKASCALSLYWLTTGLFSLSVQRVLLIPGVKERLRFPVPKPADKEKGIMKTWRDWKDDSYKKTEMRMRTKEIKRARKLRAKELKKTLKGKPPITYQIGVDAKPAAVELPDFEREWRPPRPKYFGTY